MSPLIENLLKIRATDHQEIQSFDKLRIDPELVEWVKKKLGEILEV